MCVIYDTKILRRCIRMKVQSQFSEFLHTELETSSENTLLLFFYHCRRQTDVFQFFPFQTFEVRISVTFQH